MKLRKLKSEDAPLMLEWMHDENVVQDLHKDFLSKTIEDAKEFIAECRIDNRNLHLAIVSDADEYMGTVSLKHIDKDNGRAEFAITVRSKAMGKGYSWYGMTEIIRIAFDELKLNCVYWCVSVSNRRADRFYSKHGFHETVDVPDELRRGYDENEKLKWFSVLKGDDYLNTSVKRGAVAGCPIVSIKTVPTINAGELSFLESNHDVSFDIKRIYYISKVPEGVRRGFHAHKELKQLLFCPYGKIQLILDDGNVREEITLSDPSVGVIIESPVWREMLWMQKDSVLCVAASDYYDPEDYIRDYDEFKKFKK